MKKILLFIAAIFAVGNCMAYETTVSETLKVWCDPIELVADGKNITVLTIYENDVIDYTAFNMAIIVPEGISIATIKQGRETIDYVLLTERATSSHTITSGMPDATTIKMISGSSTLSNFYNDDEEGNPLDALVTIGLLASPEMAPGTYDIKILDVKFVEPTADACVLKESPVMSTFTITNPNVTGVDNTLVDEDAGEAEWFGINGVKQTSEPSHGVYIRRQNNQSHKVIVK